MPDATTADVQDFVAQFLHTCRGTMTAHDNVWEVRMPERIAEKLKTPRRTFFTFDSEFVTPDVFLVAHGSPILDAMIDLARQRGTATHLLCGGFSLFRKLADLCTVDPWTDRSSTNCGALSNIRMKRCHIRNVKRRVFHQEQYLYHFRIAYVSDERVEETRSLLMDPEEEAPASRIDLKHAVAIKLPTFRIQKRSVGPDTHATSYTVERLYQRACEHLEKDIQPQVARYKAEARRRMESEMDRIKEYYHAMAIEAGDPLRRLLRRLAAQRVRARLYSPHTTSRSVSDSQLHALAASASKVEQTYRDELHELEREQQRRLSELHERHEVRVEIGLPNVAIVRVPRIEWTLKLSGAARRDLVFLYDVVRDTVLDLECDLCNRSTFDVNLCTCGNVLCDTCCATCHHKI